MSNEALSKSKSHNAETEAEMDVEATIESIKRINRKNNCDKILELLEQAEALLQKSEESEVQKHSESIPSCVESKNTEEEKTPHSRKSQSSPVVSEIRTIVGSLEELTLLLIMENNTLKQEIAAADVGSNDREVDEGQSEKDRLVRIEFDKLKNCLSSYELDDSKRYGTETDNNAEMTDKKISSNSKPEIEEVDDFVLSKLVKELLTKIKETLQTESRQLKDLVETYEFKGPVAKFKDFEEWIERLDHSTVGKAKEYVLAAKAFLSEQLQQHLSYLETSVTNFKNGVKDSEKGRLSDVKEKLHLLKASNIKSFGGVITSLYDAKAAIEKVESEANEYIKIVNQRLGENEEKLSNVGERVKGIYDTAFGAYNDLISQINALETRFEMEKVNIKLQVLDSREKADLKLAKELKDEKEELYEKIKRHNSEVRKLDKEIGLKSLLKELAAVEVEFKALARAESYYEVQIAKYMEIKEIIKDDKTRIKDLTLDEYDYKGCIIKVRQNDITDEPVDAIVNPANEHLTNGAGAAKMIENGAGHEYRKE